MIRQSTNEMQAGVIKNGYSYEHQCWIRDFTVIACGHPIEMDCGCFSRKHGGEQVRFSE